MTKIPKYVDEYRERIEELRDIGSEEGISMRQESEKDFWSFIETNRDIKKCGLALLDAGSLSALWTSKSEYRSAIRFFGRGKVQFTFIRYCKGESGNMSVDFIDSGKCRIDELRSKIIEFGLLIE